MYGFLMTVHICACLFLILVVLLQAGRGAGLAVFGGGGDTVFASPSGSSFLKQATSVIAITFAVTSLLLTLLSGKVGMHSVTGRELRLPQPPASQAPAQPAAKDLPQSGPAQAPASPAAPQKEAAPKKK